MQALGDAGERAGTSRQLPALFATKSGVDREIELAYLDDALADLARPVDREASPDARRLLWIIALANDPVTLGLLAAVWSGESVRSSSNFGKSSRCWKCCRRFRRSFRRRLNAMPPELRAEIDALPPVPERPDPGALLSPLEAVGLGQRGARRDPEAGNPEYSCHELVRERISAWMQQPPGDRGDLTRDAIRLAYAERLEAEFEQLQHENMSAALEAGTRAMVYLVQAGAYDRLGDFAGAVVTGASDPRLLDRLLPHLEAAASSAPEGEARWRCLTYLADALDNSGRPDTSLPFFEQAAALARAVAEAGGDVHATRGRISRGSPATGRCAHSKPETSTPHASGVWPAPRRRGRRVGRKSTS